MVPIDQRSSNAQYLTPKNHETYADLFSFRRLNTRTVPDHGLLTKKKCKAIHIVLTSNPNSTTLQKSTKKLFFQVEGS